MKTIAFRLLLPVLCAAPGFAADLIYLTDGSTIEAQVDTDSLATVAYRQDGKTKTVPSESVLKIEYERKPRLVDEADTAAADGAVEDAIGVLNTYIDGYLGGEKPKRGQEWAPAYAMYRTVELHFGAGNLAGAAEAADRLVKFAPDSRQMPMAYLAKAEAQFHAGKVDEAQKTLSEFQAVVASKALPERWRLECKLGLIRSDASLKPEDRRGRLKDLAAEAGDTFPTVKNSAKVAEAESYLTSASPDFDAARKVFKQVLDDPKADEDTLAAAHVGLGDCIFQEATKKIDAREDATAELEEALLHYMRVAVVYPDEVVYRPKALFFAGRCYDLLADTNEVGRARALDLFRRLMRDYPDSAWAANAKQYT